MWLLKLSLLTIRPLSQHRVDWRALALRGAEGSAGCGGGGSGWLEDPGAASSLRGVGLEEAGRTWGWDWSQVQIQANLFHPVVYVILSVCFCS